MAYEMKPNTGSLFKNDKKETDSHPDYKGSALIDGLGECWLDAWINTANNGSKYMSVKIKPKEARQQQGYVGSYNGDPATNASGGMSQADLDDDVPF
jgi:uncharacterized protein (DUF736 family)